MNRGRGEMGNMVAAVGGVLLVVSLFLDWYKLANFTVTAWTAFEVWDLVLAALALAVIISAASAMGWWRGPSHNLGLVILGLAALVIVASQLINPPPSVLHAATGDGGWLGLVGALLMAVGALAAESRVTLSFNAGAGGGGGLGAPGWRRSPRGPAGVPVAGPGRVPRGRGAGLGGRTRARAAEYDEDPGYDDPAYRPPPPPPRV